ncbi:zinc finger and BTB domain-containing protein 21-like isoform X2 [Scleropages formosus]|nr:zinc finger and BTB domain-containing protein 21-like isoform X2 [Scleropages formosus]XP_029111072.1 zinc finger and BTB domain-containing protein 21-like isoform X2 [Scleropages formosus]
MENLVHYINPVHTFSLLSMLNEQRLSGHLCDVTLIVADQKFHAHRSVLAASSEYFQALFARTDSDVHAVVHLDFCEPDVLEHVLNYIYSSSLFVDKESLTAIQELGYSLGISFLTNIMTTKPQISYSISRKAVFAEGNDSGCLPENVIVYQRNIYKTDESLSHVKGESFLGKSPSNQTPSSESPAAESGQCSSRTCQTPEGDRGPETLGNAEVSQWNSVTDLKERSSDGKFSQSASFPQKMSEDKSLSEKPQIMNCQDGHPSKTHDLQQTETRRPLIKSLLCRSLSVNSTVSGYSPVMDLNKGEEKADSALKLGQGTSNREPDNLKTFKVKSNNSKAIPTLLFPSQCCNTCSDLDMNKMIVRVKTEPISPFTEPSDILRVTVGEELPTSIKNFPLNTNGSEPKEFLTDYGKRRKVELGNEGGVLKKSRSINEEQLSEDQSLGITFKSSNSSLKEHQQSRTSKCKNCMRTFRSSAALHRHMNMFHNPEKPYACDICHKQFHTNFKVWTHCQTQHGIMEIPPPPSSSSITPEDRPHRKLIGMVQERELNRNVLVKLWGSKLGSLQSPVCHKRSFRAWSKSHACAWCGRMFRFLSHLRQHLRLHCGQKSDYTLENKEEILPEKDQELQLQRDKRSEVYPCRLCRKKLSSFYEQTEHEQGCLYRIVCRYCGLNFSNSCAVKEHEIHCENKKRTCQECMRTFKSPFSMWRHQMEVHKQNPVNKKQQLSCLRDHSAHAAGDAMAPESSGKKARDYSLPMVSESPEDPEGQKVISRQEPVRVKEEPYEEAVNERVPPENLRTVEPSLWSCEKCGKVFSALRELEHHQELLCYIKPFICNICQKSFRTNFRLWSHIQSHASNPDASGSRENSQLPSRLSPSPPLLATNVEESPISVAKSTAQNSTGGDPLRRTHQQNIQVSRQEVDAMSSHSPAPPALAAERQYVCKLCRRTFRSAFSLWSHEQSHSSS